VIAVVVVIAVLPDIFLLTAEVILNSAAVKTGIKKIVSKALVMDFKIESGIDIRFLTVVSLAANDLNVWINTAFYMKNYLRIGIAIRNTKISQILHFGYDGKHFKSRFLFD
jgi:hypothetical protein